MKNKKGNCREKEGRFLIAFGLLLIAAAFSLITYNLCEEQNAANQSLKVLLELTAEMQDHVSAKDTLGESTRQELVYPDYILNPNMDMPTIEIDGNDYIGILEIPDLELELPVMSHWSYSHLKTSPCRYTGSTYLNNMVIAAHNYIRHFGHLKELSEGATVIFTDIDGNVFTYKVALVEMLLPTDIETLENSNWDLTLFTCSISGSCRVTVRCNKIAEPGE